MKKYIYLILILIFSGSIFYIYKLTTYTYISAKFTHLRPMQERIPVYYKGIIVGQAKEKKHSDNLKHTFIKIVLYPKNLLLPENTTILLKKAKREKKQNDFLELIYPENPSNKMISNGSVIEGKATVDIEDVMANQNPDDIEQIKENIIQTTQNLNYALEALIQLLDTANEILKQNRNNIYQTTKNFNQMSTKINDSIDEKKLSNTLSYIESSSQNIDGLVHNLNNKTPSTIDDIQGIAQNINIISCGIRNTLSKNFAFFRFMFGQVIE